MTLPDSSARYEQILQDYLPALRRLVAAYESDLHEREDLLQDIAFAIWRALPSFRGDSSTRTFVYRIAHNRAISHRLSGSRRGRADGAGRNRGSTCWGQESNRPSFSHQLVGRRACWHRRTPARRAVVAFAPTPDQRATFRRGIHNTRFMFQWFEYVNYASPEIDSLATLMVRHHIEHDGTLATFEAMAWGDSERITSTPDLSYAATSLVRNWREFTLTQGWTKTDYDSARAVWPKVLQFEKLLYDRGVLVTVGTDANNPWTPPGASYARELELLVAAGIPPLEVIRLATHNGAETLGILDRVGTIAEGKRADLVLLDADPVADIGNTRRVEMVFANGHVVRASSGGQAAQ